MEDVWDGMEAPHATNCRDTPVKIPVNAARPPKAMPKVPAMPPTAFIAAAACGLGGGFGGILSLPSFVWCVWAQSVGEKRPCVCKTSSTFSSNDPAVAFIEKKKQISPFS